MNSETPPRREAGPADALEAGLPAFAVSVRGLTKTYKASGKTKATTALKGVDLEIPRRSLFGLLGPHGAGQSTLIHIMACLGKNNARRPGIVGSRPTADPHP